MSPADGKPRSKARKWRLYVNCGKDEHGRRIQRSKRVKGTLTEAKAELAKFEIECLGVRSRDCTFADYARGYVSKKKPTLRESTYNNRVSVVNTLIKIFGSDVKLSQMTAALIEEKLNALLLESVRDNTSQPCKPSYVASLYTFLSTIMRDAVKSGIITKNPVEDTRRPNGKPEEREAPTIEQLQLLIHDMDVTNRHEMSILLQASLGIRRGESLALRWCDVDLDTNIIHIRHNLALNCVLTQPKTPESKRDLPIPDYLRPKLLARRELVVKHLERSVRGELLKTMPDLDEIFVCCDEMGRPVGPASQTSWWANHRDRFGMKGYTEHDIRHGYLTALARSNVPPVVMQAMAGHATPNITLGIYSHVQNEDLKAAAALYNNVMNVENEN